MLSVKTEPSFKSLRLVATPILTLLAEQVREFAPEEVAIPLGKAAEFRALFPEGQPANIQLKEGAAALIALSENRAVDRVVLALAGKSGVKPLFAALAAQKTLVLANKEALVVGGAVATKQFPHLKDRIQPIDSEHSAIAQAMQGHLWSEVRKIYLTASGGPFYTKPWAEFDQITQEQALNHPKWKFMGSKVTIDSASLMNKALELIEAHYLFGLAPSQIEALYHPESSVHGIVEFKDGNFLAHLSGTDMRYGIAYALSCPPPTRPKASHHRLELVLDDHSSQHPSAPAFSFLESQKFQFAPLDRQKFPSLKFAYRVLALQGGASAFLNGANARLVEAFFQGQIRFSGIFQGLSQAMQDLEACFAEPKKRAGRFNRSG